MHDVVTAWRRALVAEICWSGRDTDRPDAVPAVPLVLDGMPCVALPYARLPVATALAGAREVACTVTDARSVGRDRPGVAAFGTVTVTHDLDGSAFTERLLDQELAKYPPSRTLADSLLLRRENWWWLPRLIVRLDRVTRTAEVPVRTDPATHGVLVRDGTGLVVDTVSVAPEDPPRACVTSLSRVPVRGDTAPAVILGHDYTAADLERWECWTLRGRLMGERLHVEESGGRPGAALPPLRLTERIRRQRDLEKACRKGIAAAEAGRARE